MHSLSKKQSINNLYLAILNQEPSVKEVFNRALQHGVDNNELMTAFFFSLKSKNKEILTLIPESVMNYHKTLGNLP